MLVFRSVMTVLFGFNALLFSGLMIRRSRPEMLARLFSWVIHTKTGRKSRRPARHLPAQGIANAVSG
jgi:hypothetical protein